MSFVEYNFVFWICLLCILPVTSHDWPIIGLFAQPSSSFSGSCNGSCQYITANYVKYLESAGARVIPINFYATNEELDIIFNGVNGFLFPGGGVTLPPSAQYVYDKVIKANDAGDFTPLWGTCMGFQWLLMATTRDINILDPKDGVQFDAYNISMNLEFDNTLRDSRLFSKAGEQILHILRNEDVTMNVHHYGIYPEHFKNNSVINGFYRLLSINQDRLGVSFVSTMEAYNYPIYGTQWHPEKNVFE